MNYVFGSSYRSFVKRVAADENDKSDALEFQ